MQKAPARAMLRAVGMTDDDWDKPQIGVASSWNEITPCNLSLQRLALRAKDGVFKAGGFPLQFGTISVSDGISMGHEGMRASLVSREVIADSVETVMHAERLDGLSASPAATRASPGCSWPPPGSTCRWSSSTPARSCPATTTARRSTSRASSRPSAPAPRCHHRGRPRPDRAQGLPRRGRLRRHVHRQHHGVDG